MEKQQRPRATSPQLQRYLGGQKLEEPFQTIGDITSKRLAENPRGIFPMGWLNLLDLVLYDCMEGVDTGGRPMPHAVTGHGLPTYKVAYIDGVTWGEEAFGPEFASELALELRARPTSLSHPLAKNWQMG